MYSTDSDNNVPTTLLALSIVFSIIPTIAVALRFQAIRRARSRLFWDDWTILVSVLSCITMGILIIIGVVAGNLGQHLKFTDGKPIYDSEYVIFQKVQYGVDFAQLLALGPTKVSVLFLYRRIFGDDGRRFNIISMSLILIVIAWTIAFFFTNAFQYTPVYSMWASTPAEAHPTFKQSTKMFLAQSYADVALDTIIISLPVPLIWKLQMTLRRKLQISAIFLLGAMTVGASIARTVIQYGVAREFDSHNLDKTYYLAPIVYWPLIEAALGIVAGCLPLLRPIGQIYSVRNLVLVSSKALSTIFTASSRRSRKSSRGYASNSETGSSPPTRREDTSQSDKWLRPYNLSILQQTIDNESQVESHPMSAASEEEAASDDIKCERGYQVNYEVKEKTDSNL
ncbi:hypothetical protein F4815DRAFT_450808 [Daldinia loculata]|nr:hypothetical protein F4815DRAFT_450808 [Daldinia loculata]